MKDNTHRRFKMFNLINTQLMQLEFCFINKANKKRAVSIVPFAPFSYLFRQTCIHKIDCLSFKIPGNFIGLHQFPDSLVCEIAAVHLQP